MYMRSMCSILVRNGDTGFAIVAPYPVLTGNPKKDPRVWML